MLASILLVGCSTFSRHCRINLSAHWRKFSLAALRLSQNLADYTKKQKNWQQTYCIDIEKPISRFLCNNLQFIRMGTLLDSYGIERF